MTKKKVVPKGLEKLNEGIEKMKDPKLIIYIMKEVQKEGLIGEEDTIIALIMKVMLRLVKNSRATSSNVVISDKSGGGKDWITKCVCNVLLRKNAYFHRSRLSEKAFTYWHSKDKDFTWDGKVIHLEDPDAEFLNSQAFKVRASGETEETVIKDQKALDIKVEGKPVIIVTSLEASLNVENIRRWDTCRIDTSSTLTKKMMLYNAMLASGEIKVKKDEALREALHQIVPKDVVIPYSVAVAMSLPPLLGMRTQQHKFFDYIKASAVLHQYQRNKTEDGEIIANMFDYEYARFCFMKFSNMRGVPLNIAEEQLLDVLLQGGRPMQIKEILPKINRGQRWIYDKIERLKELDCIKEIYIMDDQAGKDVKHIFADEKMAYKAMVDANEIMQTYKGFEGGFAGGFAEDKNTHFNRRKLTEFEGGFAEFQENAIHILKNHNNKNNILYTTYLQINAKPIAGQKESDNAKPLQKGSKTSATTDGKLDLGYTLADKINDLRKFIEDNKKAGYDISYGLLTSKFGQAFIEKCKEKGILIRNGDEYVCT